jgi:hypothetical protein
MYYNNILLDAAKGKAQNNSVRIARILELPIKK